MNIKESIYLKMLDCYSVPPPESGGIFETKLDMNFDYLFRSSYMPV